MTGLEAKTLDRMLEFSPATMGESREQGGLLLSCLAV
jgi:hypothetical protein